MATAFTFEAVADNVAAGGDGGIGLAVDRAGNPNIAFLQPGNGQIVVARRNGGTWTHKNAQGAFVSFESRPCIAIDSQGNPHLAYKNLSSGELVHTFKSGAQWSSTVIRTRLDPQHQPGGIANVALALHPGRTDPASRDAAYFVYVDLGSDGIGFAHTGAGRTPTTVQMDPNHMTTFSGPSAVFDPSENFFVAYVGIFETGSPQDSILIRTAHLTDNIQSAFSTPLVVDGSRSINVRRATSIARTSGSACIAYFDSASKTLKAAINLSGIAGIEPIATNINTFVTPSAAAARFGDFRVAYADVDAVKLASRGQLPDWTVETVDAVSAGPVSLAYDSSGTAHIAYVAGGKVKYARRSE